ncbi:polysaccharide pyruvyl transferase family protein [Herbiconiux sp. UC225_62]|uniref:polysaccharide pyruvyl transferase family protein n=1 Tax=Herbiconiux sp. UC225_62 TaxID=3350168 RepID=UPI0036D29071
MNNFGDLLGPMIVLELLRRRGIDPSVATNRRRLVSVGSVMHIARAGDVVWGSGVNGKFVDRIPPTELDIRAVRGPRTARILRSAHLEVPDVYGDPGLLTGMLWPRDGLAEERERSQVLVVPNLNDFGRMKKFPSTTGIRLLNPQLPIEQCLRAIANADLVVGSSLHGIVVAESFGVPARLVKSVSEPGFKYEDYFLGSGRTSVGAAATVSDAIKLGGHDPLAWDSTPLLEAFPYDLWVEPEA